MKDFIEGIQKLLPWLAGLQAAPKIVISIIIVLAAAFILLLIWSPTSQTKENRHSGPSLNTGSESSALSKLTVKEIVDAINNSAPFQREDVAKNYRGIKVKWEGKLWDVNKTSTSIGDSVRVQLNPEPNEHLYSIYFDVPIETYPQLKIAQRGDLIGVLGTIINCSGAGMNVTLDADEVIFPKNHNEKP
jgi:hypothetical protein